MSGLAVEHALCADILIDIRPMNPVTIANQFPVGPLCRRRFRQAPRPRQRYTDDAPVHQVGGDEFVRHFDTVDSNFNADRSAHAKPRQLPIRVQRLRAGPRSGLAR
jgi:hypothetical protein